MDNKLSILQGPVAKIVVYVAGQMEWVGDWVRLVFSFILWRLCYYRSYDENDSRYDLLSGDVLSVGWLRF